MEKLLLKVSSVLVIALLTSSCMTMGLGHLSTNQQQNQSLSRERYVDPVCGNSIENVSEDLSYEYGGSAYYFHTSGCLNEFKNAPEKYIDNSNMGHHRNYNGMMWGLGAVAMVGMMFLMVL